MKALKSLQGGCISLGLLLLCSIARNDAAAPIVYQATGTREQIQPVIDQFKHDILYGIGGDPQQSPILGSVKTVTFDDVSAGSEKTVESIVVPLLRSSGEDAANDMVAIDDFIYGVVIPEPSPMLLGLVGGLLIWITFESRRPRPEH